MTNPAALFDADGRVNLIAIVNHLRQIEGTDVETRTNGLNVHIDYRNAALLRDHAADLLGPASEENLQIARHYVTEQHPGWDRTRSILLYSSLPALDQATLIANAICAAPNTDPDTLLVHAQAASSTGTFGSPVHADSPTANILATLLLDGATHISGPWHAARACAHTYAVNADLLEVARALAQPPITVKTATPRHTTTSRRR